MYSKKVSFNFESFIIKKIHPTRINDNIFIDESLE